MAAATQAWPEGQAPIQSLRFEQGSLTLVVGTWSGDQIERFRTRLRSAGWNVQVAEGRLVLSRGGAARSAT